MVERMHRNNSVGNCRDDARHSHGSQGRARARDLRHFRLVFERLLATAFTLGSIGCSTIAGGNSPSNPIVGAWLVKEPAAPFPYQMYVLNADGTMQQANPAPAIRLRAIAMARVYGLRRDKELGVSGSK